MILLFEPICWNQEHVPFNAGMIEVACQAYPTDQVHFHSEATHMQAVLDQLRPDVRERVVGQSVKVPSRRATYLNRLRTELGLIRAQQRLLNESHGHLVILSSLPSTILALKLARQWDSCSDAVHVILHGDANSGLFGRRYRRPIRRLQDMKTAVSLLGNRGVYYVTLEEPIRDALVGIVPSLANNVATLEHPLPPVETTVNPSTLAGPVKIGFLGLATEQKGFPLFTRIAAQIKSNVGREVEFHAICRVPPGGVNGSLDALDTRPVEGYLSRHEYVARLQQLHFVVFPFSSAYYTGCPSGTLLDAIAWEKPVIASRIPIFERLFEKFGDLGYLFTGEMDLCSIIMHLVQSFDTSRYRDQCSNIRRVKQSRMPPELAVRFRSLIEDSQRAAVA